MSDGTSDAAHQPACGISDGSEPDSVRESFEGLAGLDPALALRAGRYVVMGEDAEVLNELERLPPDTGELLGNPGWLSERVFPVQRRELAEKSRTARRAVYESNWHNADLLIRLGKVLAAVDQGRSVDVPVEALPDWLRYLSNDVLWGSAIRDPIISIRLKNPIEQNRRVNVGFLHDLLEREGYAGTLALLLVFERGDLEECVWEPLEPLVAAETLNDYLLQHAEAVSSLPERLSSSGLLVLSRVLGRAALASVFAAVQLRLAVASGQVIGRVAALQLQAVPQDQRLDLLAQLLLSEASAERERAAELMACCVGEAGREVLANALAREKKPGVQQALSHALADIAVMNEAASMSLPPAPAFTVPPETMLGSDFVTSLHGLRQRKVEEFRLQAEEEIRHNLLSVRVPQTFCQEKYRKYQALTDEDLSEAVAVVNGQRPGLALTSLQRDMLGWSDLFTRPECSCFHFLRCQDWHAGKPLYFWGRPGFREWRQRQDAATLDLRSMLVVLETCGFNAEALAVACLEGRDGADGEAENGAEPRPQVQLPPERVWPFFADHPHFIAEGLGCVAPAFERYPPFSLGLTLRALQTFPALSPRWIPRLLETAFGGTENHRGAAQRVLQKLPNIAIRVVAALGSSRPQVRKVAAAWLADLQLPATFPALRAALEVETQDGVRSKMIIVLERLGEDVQALATPAALLLDAQRGFRGKPPQGLNWFPFSALPVCRWAADDSEVEPVIICWWVVLAHKERKPTANALLKRYLGLLNSGSRAALGSFLLSQFIARDIRGPSLTEARAYAQEHSARWHCIYQSRDPEYAGTEEKAFEELLRRKLGEYLGDANADRGILALTAGGNASELVAMLDRYIRHHHRRRTQIEYMLEALSSSDEPPVLQLLLAIARRFSSPSVQTKAREWVEQAALRLGWTQEQLADRSVPCAGFDESGRMELGYGGRCLIVQLDPSLQPRLQTAEGRALKALPAPRQDDDPAVIKEAKQQFADCKQELKQVIEWQVSRLYDAMCSGHIWSKDDWQQYVLAHPIMWRLAQGLIWRLVGEGPEDGVCFRPDGSGSFLTADGTTVDGSIIRHLRLAHAVYMSYRDIQCWRQHLQNYAIEPWFEQLAHGLPALIGDGLTRFTEWQGWMTDAFSLRELLSLRGYRIWDTNYEGFFDTYAKTFHALDISVFVEFSGNFMPEDNVPVALKAMYFKHWAEPQGGDYVMPLDLVPPVLLAEAYAEFGNIAAGCTGFDPAWETKARP